MDEELSEMMDCTGVKDLGAMDSSVIVYHGKHL